MKLTKSAVEELRKIIETEYCIKISFEKAEKQGTALLNIYAEIFKPEVKGTHEQ